MIKKTKIIKLKKLYLPFITILGILVGSQALVFVYKVYKEKFPPQTFVADVNISLLSPQAALAKLEKELVFPKEVTLVYSADPKITYKIALNSIDTNVNLGRTVADAHTAFLHESLKDTLLSIITNKRRHIQVFTTWNKDKLANHIQIIADKVTTEPIYPTVFLQDKNIIVERGKAGETLDPTSLINLLESSLENVSFEPLAFSTTQVNPAISESQFEDAKSRGELLINKKITLSFEDRDYVIKGNEILSFIEPTGLYKTDLLQKKANDLAQTFNREAQNPAFVFVNQKVEEFKPAKSGIEVQKDLLAQNLRNTLADFESENSNIDEAILDLPVIETPPTVQTGDVNNLGIKELIGRGTSKFRGSIPSRIHNVALASSKIHGVLIAPGETFSFNQVLGDISKYTGFKEAYVIKDGKTVLGDGGGVCQVSTTLFRAALNAGLPITERHAHSYRVGYYEQDAQPGLDASVYSPTSDLKIENNTSAHILIQTTVDTKNTTLAFELYGTSDGRIVNLTKPTLSNSIPPAEDLYVDDPTLAAGVIKQVEHKAWGGKSQFSYEVVRNNETIFKKVFTSTYRPWQAVYLRGVGPQI